MNRHLVLLGVLLLVSSGCGKKVDVAAEEAAILKADADWAAALVANDPDGFLSFFTADAIVMAPHLTIIVGMDAIRAWATESMGFPGFSVNWVATSGEVAASGDMGYTVGTFTFQMTMPDGTPITDMGKYTTIWEKQADGSWKVAVDTFNSDIAMIDTDAPSDTTGAAGQ